MKIFLCFKSIFKKKLKKCFYIFTCFPIFVGIRKILQNCISITNQRKQTFLPVKFILVCWQKAQSPEDSWDYQSQRNIHCKTGQRYKIGHFEGKLWQLRPYKNKYLKFPPLTNRFLQSKPEKNILIVFDNAMKKYTLLKAPSLIWSIIISHEMMFLAYRADREYKKSVMHLHIFLRNWLRNIHVSEMKQTILYRQKR